MSGHEPDDGALLHRITAGDSDALLTLHQRYVNLVYSMAWRVLQDVGLAEEVTQDIFMKLWQRSQLYDAERGPFSSWLLTITRFAAIDRLRSEGCQRPPCSTRMVMSRRRSNDCCPRTMPVGSAVSIFGSCWNNCRRNSARLSSSPTSAV
jgi:DNA-directed RNA polymerase specialized sigma24 family protein